MILNLSLQHPTGVPILTATTDTNTRRSSDLAIDPEHLPAVFIALNTLLGEIEAHLAIGTIAQPLTIPTY